MRITSLVTGGTGFIGSHVVKNLLELGHHVVVLDDLSGSDLTNLNPKADFHQGSILNQDLIASLFEQYNFDYVYHLAAYAAEGLSHFIRNFNYQNNLIGSINLINASVNQNIKCFVFASSIAVYGTNELPHTEAQKPQPEDPYGIAKYAVEMDLANAHKLFGLDYVILRPHNVYGTNQNLSDPYRNVIGIFMNQLLQNKPLTIFGTGNQTRAFTHIDDVAPYIANAINIKEACNHTFNIGSDETHSINSLAAKVCKAMNLQQETTYLEAREEVTHAYANHEKFKRVFNPKESIKLEEGLKEMAEWAKTYQLKSPKPIESIEIMKNLPESWKTL